MHWSLLVLPLVSCLLFLVSCSDCLYTYGFRVCFTPLPGFFSPFLHSTRSLSVSQEYLALEDGPPARNQESEARSQKIRVASPRFIISINRRVATQTFLTPSSWFLTPVLQTGFLVSRLTLWSLYRMEFAYGAFTLSRGPFQTLGLSHTAVSNRALPLSLAATHRISVDFFSSRY